MRHVEVSAAIAERAKAIAQKLELTTERTLREIARVAYSDIRRLFDKDGNLIPIPELDEDTAAMLASFEVDENFAGQGKEREMIGLTKKLKLWDKNAALEKAMKFHGLYEKDNAQRSNIFGGMPLEMVRAIADQLRAMNSA